LREFCKRLIIHRIEVTRRKKRLAEDDRRAPAE